MGDNNNRGQSGFTLIELVVSMVVLGILSASILGLYVTLVSSAILAKRKAVALTLATNQMEYLKGLPYNSLAVAGGSIPHASPLPATTNKVVNNVTYVITTSISYVDDAFDGCFSYPTQALKEQYCRNYPPPSGAPALDTNRNDYKVIHVSTTSNGIKLAEIDTQVSARVAETASTTGALFVRVITDSGDPISGATVQLTNTTVTPNVNLSDTSDSNGIAIFYDLTPDTTNYDYVVTASKTGYSTLSTIPPSGSLQPNWRSQQIFTQQSSISTMILKPMGEKSLIIEAVNTSGAPIANLRVYIKGGYKRYNDSANTAYYYDNLTPSDARPTTDASGNITISNLVPGPYIFCGDAGATSCAVGGTTYYLVAAVPYGGSNPLNPIDVPIYSLSSPPATTFPYGAENYLQKVRLIFSTSSTYPRVRTLDPGNVSLGSGSPGALAFTLTGTNLTGTIRFLQGANTYTATGCSGNGTQQICTVNLSTASVGNTQLEVVSGGNTLTLPAAPLLGGILIEP